MTRTHLIAIVLVHILVSFVLSPIYSQSSEDLMGRWEGVHYYGDTTRLYNGVLLVRATTIDSMKMILTFEQLEEGKFKGKIHEHFYSDPKGSYYNAEVSGFINNGKIHFTTFVIKENKLPRGYRWCEPKATGFLVKKAESYFLHMSFMSTLTCTVGPAIAEKKILQNVTKTPADSSKQLPPQVTESIRPPAITPGPQSKQELLSISEKFKRRNRSVITTINVQSDSIKINFFDNATVDGDSISVFINGQLEVSHVRLRATPFSINVRFENGKNEIEIAMFAENLGTIPPNTALMQVVEGNKFHQAYLSSDNTSNAVIKIKRVR
jgi:hypothetical protein